MTKYIKLFEEHTADEEELKQLRDLGLADPELTYDLNFSIDIDWAMYNGPAETVTEITNLINGVGDLKGVGKVSAIDVSGTVGIEGIDWDGPIGDAMMDDDDDPDEFDNYVFDSDAVITFTSFLKPAEIKDFINDQLIHLTAYGNYDLELLDNL